MHPSTQPSPLSPHIPAASFKRAVTAVCNALASFSLLFFSVSAVVIVAVVAVGVGPGKLKPEGAGVVEGISEGAAGVTGATGAGVHATTKTRQKKILKTQETYTA